MDARGRHPRAWSTPTAGWLFFFLNLSIVGTRLLASVFGRRSDLPTWFIVGNLLYCWFLFPLTRVGAFTIFVAGGALRGALSALFGVLASLAGLALWILVVVWQFGGFAPARGG